MTLSNEQEVYDQVKVSPETCEILSYDQLIFPQVIRKRELKLIFNLIEETKPEHILDYGCGAGWLCKILSEKGYKVTGVDISPVLINKAKKSIPDASFLSGDCLNLPLPDDSFDLIIGVAILHHLDLDKALTECKRVSRTGAKLFFIEPNRFNPISAAGNKMAILDAHTEDEAPYNPLKLKKQVEKIFILREMYYLFPYSFGLAYLSGKIHNGRSQLVKSLIPVIDITERIYEKIPILKLTSSQIAIILENIK